MEVQIIILAVNNKNEHQINDKIGLQDAMN